MENVEKTPDMFDSVRAILSEIALASEERMQDFERKMAYLWKWLETSSAKSDRDSAALDKKIAATNAAIDKLSRENTRMSEEINGISKSNGLYAEDYFFNSFKEKKCTFFGEKFDYIFRNMPSTIEEKMDEYDIVLVNGKYVGIVEVKYKGRLDHIKRIINKAQTFRANFPHYQNHKIYLAFASTVFNQRLEQECDKEGIVVVKPLGDTFVINDKKKKVF